MEKTKIWKVMTEYGPVYGITPRLAEVQALQLTGSDQGPAVYAGAYTFEELMDWLKGRREEL